MTTNKRIYLDYAAATPLDDRVKQAMDPFMSVIFANPSSLHAQGKQAAQAIADARTEIASLLTARPQELIFTGSGTESCNLAIQGVCRAREKQGKHLIVTAAEHHAVLEAARDLERRGWELTIVPVDKYGLVDAKRLAGAVRPVTVLVSVIWANNEVGSSKKEESGNFVSYRRLPSGRLFTFERCFVGD
jgi:cysteine desulfurase